MAAVACLLCCLLYYGSTTKTHPSLCVLPLSPALSRRPISSCHDDSDEVLWGNLPMRRTQRIARTLGMGALFVAILIFYLPVTAAIQVSCCRCGCWWCASAFVCMCWSLEAFYVGMVKLGGFGGWGGACRTSDDCVSWRWIMQSGCCTALPHNGRRPCTGCLWCSSVVIAIP